MLGAFSRFHYIHHSTFNCNYGGLPIWDFICGTQEVVLVEPSKRGSLKGVVRAFREKAGTNGTDSESDNGETTASPTTITCTSGYRGTGRQLTSRGKL